MGRLKQPNQVLRARSCHLPILLCSHAARFPFLEGRRLDSQFARRASARGPLPFSGWLSCGSTAADRCAEIVCQNASPVHSTAPLKGRDVPLCSHVMMMPWSPPSIAPRLSLLDKGREIRPRQRTVLFPASIPPSPLQPHEVVSTLSDFAREVLVLFRPPIPPRQDGVRTRLRSLS